MNYDRYSMLASEIAELESIIAGLPEYRKLEKMSLEIRLKRLKEELEALQPTALVEKAVITFRGRPVVGTHGILADFAAKASGAFVDAVSSVAAALSGSLGDMGPIPDRDKNKLLITNIARGSFGFEFEVPKNGEDTLLPEESAASVALEKITELFEDTIEGNEDKMTEIVQEIHPRAVKKVVEFMDTVYKHDAWFSFQFRNTPVKFKDVGEIEKFVKLLSDENIREDKVEFIGHFVGAMPHHKNFEFETEDGEIVSGKIGSKIKEPDLILKKYYRKKVKVIFHTMQIGNSKPKYSIEDFKDIQVLENEK